MAITGEQAAKLLEGTTPGPWKASPHQWPEQVGCCPLVGRPYSAAYKMRNVAAANTAPDIQLIAAAPDLARALIASEDARKLAEERLAKVKAAFRVNMLRVDPTISHEAIDAILKEIDNG